MTISVRFRWLIFAALAIFAAVGAIIYSIDAKGSEAARSLRITHDGSSTVLATDGIGEFHLTSAVISEARSIEVSNIKIFTWVETADASSTPFYAIIPAGKPAFVRQTSYEMMLRFAEFDPLLEVPQAPFALRSSETESGARAFIVQFVTQPLEEYRKVLDDLGARTYIYLPNHAHIVQMDNETRAKVEQLPFVRWVGSYEPAYKLDEPLIAGLERQDMKPARYNIMLLERGPEKQERLASSIRSFGGRIDGTVPEGFRIEATLNADDLLRVAHDPDVLFIDRWSPPESDMNIVRSVGGADFIENTLGFRGEGVRAEVMDNGLRQTHGDFNSGLPPIIHNSSNTNESPNHGTSTFGINFGRGTANATGRGMLPEAQGIFADYDFLGTGRYSHTARLLQAPYNAVYQSNSWGSSLTTSYNTISAELDDILFINDIVVLNSQSNNGNRSSRPQAWAKNVVSIGGIRHFNTATTNDDRWQSGASIGPASDGRIKPDLAHFYDSVYTTSNVSDTSYTTGFGGTSAATPITAGHFGLFFQMWHEGLFGNPTSSTVFNSRPHMTTAKAIMINTAVQWDMTLPGTDITRVRQGYGRANVENLYNLRSRMLVIDETSELTNMQTATHTVNVAPGSSDPLKITMVYADPMGSPSASRARINDLTLKVTSPDGIVYWGNNGLESSMWSTPGGSPNVVDTVENVFIEDPTGGVWTIEVTAFEINQDARPESAGLSADYALVASGISPLVPTAAAVSISGRVVNADGRGIAGVKVRIAGRVERTGVTGPFGYYRFDDIAAGSSYAITASSKRYTFNPPTIVRTVNDEMTDVDFVAAR